MQVNKRVTCIDHHISNEAAVKMTHKYSYAKNNSGSVLAWKYFHSYKPVPKMLLYIEDMDLWRFKVARTKEIFAFLDLYDFNFKLLEKLAEQIQNPKTRQVAIAIGKTVLSYENKLVDRMVRQNAELVEFEGYKTLAVNSPNFSSQIGHELSKILPPIAIIWSERKGKVIVSLRSDGSVDVSQLASKYGGGGHKAASGFSFPAGKKFPWKLLRG